ncbi:MAG: nucleotidyl transferase AbiEii/AbiGii toxin family protein [Candidatus Avelusimicrobium sp.]|uniref:nucleotidyl transferase AbiEii/AbiGii toxin family protein n=1 Tax=Candidatus Avelusimicrobium sp. TaxID=3048833 RepID=UPI003F0EDDC7
MKKNELTTEQVTQAAGGIFKELAVLAASAGNSFEEMLYRYLQERFLYLLSRSAYKDKFTLKDYSRPEGAASGRAYAAELHFQKAKLKVTQDTPLEEIRRAMPELRLKELTRLSLPEINREMDIGWIQRAFTEICDGILFDKTSVTAAYADGGKNQDRVQIGLKASLGAAAVKMRFWVDFENFTLPKEKRHPLPVLKFFSLVRSPAALAAPARLQTYSSETVAAEKIAAMRGTLPVRVNMWDFYELYLAATKRPLHTEALKDRLRELLKSILLTDWSAFKRNLLRHYQPRWQTFLSANGLTEAEIKDFEAVLECIVSSL